MEKTLARYEEEISELQRKRKEIIASAKRQAEEILSESNAVVENTIREIKEAQAEKERTREVRQELDAFRTMLGEHDQAKDDAIERKMQQLIARKQRKEERRRQRQTADNTQAQNGPKPQVSRGPEAVGTGQMVSLKGQSGVGTIEEIKGKKAVVMFGQIRTILPLDMLEPAKGEQKPQPATMVSHNYISRATLDQMHKTQLNFRQEIDIRGMRGDEAVQTITSYIDDAILVGTAQVRILHGTGNGILRQLIRQYLGTVPQVRSAHDEHVQFGGAGITVVEFR